MAKQRVRAVTAFRTGCARVSRHAFVAGLSTLVGLTGCAGGVTAEPPASTPAATPSPTPGATTAAFAETHDPVAIEPGTYRVPKSEWSVADFTVDFPEGWTVQAGHIYAGKPNTDEEFGFYAVVVDTIYADACTADGERPIAVGPTVDDLAGALLEQPGPEASGPVDTTLGGYPASRIDFTVPTGFDLNACRLEGLGLQIWHSPPTDKYFVLLPDGIASAYIVDVDGQRQVFLTQRMSGTSEEDVAELQAVLDSIHILS